MPRFEEEERTVKRVEKESDRSKLWKKKSKGVRRSRAVNVLNGVNQNVAKDQIIPSNIGNRRGESHVHFQRNCGWCDEFGSHENLELESRQESKLEKRRNLRVFERKETRNDNKGYLDKKKDIYIRHFPLKMATF